MLLSGLLSSAQAPSRTSLTPACAQEISDDDEEHVKQRPAWLGSSAAQPQLQSPGGPLPLLQCCMKAALRQLKSLWSAAAAKFSCRSQQADS